jgi:hypothetical protein
VATGVPITISIGSNATFQNQGTHWITNPGSGGAYVLSVGGTFGGTGNIDIAINPGVQLSATIAETLTLVLAGLPPKAAIGNEMSACASSSGPNTMDFNDGVTVITVTSTAISIPFGTIDNLHVFEACIKVSITTNAGNGYSIRTRENNPMETADGAFSIPGTGCDNNGCLNTLSTSDTWASFFSNNGMGISCANPTTSISCSLTNPQFANAGATASSGKNWAPIANEGSLNTTGGTQTSAMFSGLSVATSVEVITKAKFRITVPNLQPAGTRTNLVSFIMTPVY